MIRFLTVRSRTSVFATLLTILPLLTQAAGYEFKTVKVGKEDDPKAPLKVVGCLKTEVDSKKAVALRDCLEDADLKKSLKLYWKLDSERKNVIGCEQVTESTRPVATIADLPQNACLAELPYTKAFTVNGRNEIDGCKGVAKYRNAEFAITNFNSCYKENEKDFEYVFIIDSGKDGTNPNCLVLSGGKRFADAKYGRRACSLEKNKPIGAVQLSTDLDKIEGILNVWSENKNGTCLAIAESSLQILGDVEKSQCDELILKTTDGKRRLIGTVAAKRIYTFRKMLLDPRMNGNMQSELGAACTDTINKITRAGGSLASKTLQQASTQLGKIRVHSGVQDNLFYHWTSSPGLFTLFSIKELGASEASKKAKLENLYEQMFYYLRTRTADQYQFWRRVFYVAEDSQSSDFLGSSLLEFTLDPNAKSITYNLSSWQASMDEVASKYPELAQNCKMKLDWTIRDTFGSILFSNVFFIVAEDSGIQVIEFNQGGRWFQILGSEPFVSLRFVR